MTKGKKSKRSDKLSTADEVKKALHDYLANAVRIYSSVSFTEPGRCFIAGINEEKTCCFMLFKGKREDIMKMKDFLDREDEKQG
jgi:hypothetical protein